MNPIFSIFQRGLQKTATSISRSISSVLAGAAKWDAETFRKLEASLISADFGPSAAKRIASDIKDRYDRGLIRSSEDIMKIAEEDIAELLKRHRPEIKFQDGSLSVVLIVGVNGSGKTTSAGKLASLWKSDGKKVMLAACDTFRAAAVQQLKLWGERTGCPVVSSFQGADPSAVAFDAVQSAAAKKYDFLIIDTAGRQHTKKGLMEELSKMKRVIAKSLPGAPQAVWLTVDAAIGTNALSQAREFLHSAGINGLILTKLDGTGKGGAAAAVQEEFKVPIIFVGLGEKPEDLQPFDPDMFANALFST